LTHHNQWMRYKQEGHENLVKDSSNNNSYQHTCVLVSNKILVKKRRENNSQILPLREIGQCHWPVRLLATVIFFYNTTKWEEEKEKDKEKI